MDWIKRNELTVFLSLAFAFSWWPWPFNLLNPNSAPMIPWGPVLAAFIVLGWTRGWSGVRSLAADMFRWRVGVRWYAIAFLLPIGITFAAVYLNTLLGGPALPSSVFNELKLFFPALLATTLLAGPFTEEPAWRGFFLPRLQSKHSSIVASLTIGIIWWIWHAPLMISDPTGQRPPFQYLMSIMAYSILFTWVYNRTQASVFVITLMHGTTNTIASFLFRGLFGEYYAQLWWLYAGLWWIVSLYVLVAPNAQVSTNKTISMEQA
jgi:membrane protease YdiL (CAAX protease family)